jgi:glycosyltransferase involved in cell wall biosynthesis
MLFAVGACEDAEMKTSNNKPIKILLILWPSPSKPDLMLKKLNEITAKMDNNWKVFALKGNLPEHFSGRLILPCSSEFYSVRMFGPRKSVASRISYFLNCVVKGVRLVKEENIPVVTQHDGHLEYGMAAYIVSRLTHRKCLIRVNEDTLIPLIFFLKSSDNPLFKSQTLLKIVVFTYRRIEHAFFKHVDWIITHGPMDYQKIKKITNRITFVPLGVDIEKFKRLDEKDIRNLRKGLAITKDVKILLFVGRLHPEKGVTTLLKALKIISNMKVLLLMVYSFSEYKKEYEKLAKHLRITDKVRFVGYVSNDELPKYYNIADLYVLPSMREEWSNTIMEAMACMTPVIATDVGANPYLINEGKTGFLVPSSDSWSLAQKIRFILENPDFVRQVTQTAVNEIRKYDLNIVGESYKTVVTNLLKNN